MLSPNLIFYWFSYIFIPTATQVSMYNFHKKEEINTVYPKISVSYIFWAQLNLVNLIWKTNKGNIDDLPYSGKNKCELFQS